MFNIVQSPKDDQCAAVRCTKTPAPPTDSEGNDCHPPGLKLCMAHMGEWVQGGKPELTSGGKGKTPAKAKGTALSPSEALQEEMAAQEARAKAALALIDDKLRIVDEASKAQARQAMKHFGDQIKDLEAKRKTVSEPLNKALKAHNDMFRPPREWLQAAVKLIKDRLAAFEVEQREAQRQALTEVSQGARDESTIVVAHGRENVDTGAKRITVKWRVTDASLVPEALTKRVVDEEKVAALVAKHGMDVAGHIPGVEVYEDITIINR